MSFTPEMDALHKLNVNLAELDKYSILLLPENIFESSYSEGLFEGQDTGILYKYLREKGINCGVADDFGVEIPILERRSRDRWFGVIWIRDKLVIPILVGAISGLLVTEVTTKHEPTRKAHAEIIIESESRITKIKFQGAGEDLIRIIQAFEDSPPEKDGSEKEN
jgi:hypothetical protein